MDRFINATKRFDATSLSDEEMQAALKRKNRWMKFKNFLGGLGKVAMGLGGLYGLSRLNNGGYLDGIKTALGNGLSRFQGAAEYMANGQSPDGQQANQQANDVVTQLTPQAESQQQAPQAQSEAPAQQTGQDANANANQVVEGAVDQQAQQSQQQAPAPQPDGQQANADANQVVAETAGQGQQAEAPQGQGMDQAAFDKVTTEYFNAMKSDNVEELQNSIAAIQGYMSQTQDPEQLSRLQSYLNELTGKMQTISRFNTEYQAQANAYNNAVTDYNSQMANYNKLKGGLKPGYNIEDYGITKPQLTATKPADNGNYWTANNGAMKFQETTQEKAAREKAEAAAKKAQAEAAKRAQEDYYKNQFMQIGVPQWNSQPKGQGMLIKR